MQGVCFLNHHSDGEKYEEQTTYDYGKLIPKDGKTYHILIRNDNPDIDSLTTEKRLTEQACKELEKQIGYNLKIYHQLDYHPSEGWIDVFIDFKDNDSYFQNSTLAYAGYPSGSLRGKVVFNNKFPWLDGTSRSGKELRELGIILDGMNDEQIYRTYNYRQTVKHELCGHVFGLPHTNDATDVMFPYYGDERMMFGKESKNLLNSKYGTAPVTKRALPDAYIKAVMSRKL